MHSPVVRPSGRVVCDQKLVGVPTFLAAGLCPMSVYCMVQFTVLAVKLLEGLHSFTSKCFFVVRFYGGCFVGRFLEDNPYCKVPLASVSENYADLAARFETILFS